MFAHGPTPCAERVAIVTGGSRGVGREVTRKLALGGFAVVVTYARNQGSAEAAVEEVLAANGVALAVRADIADALDVDRLFTETVEAFGGVDVLVHADRMALAPVADHELGAFAVLPGTKVRGMFVVNQRASRQLREGGAIVNLTRIDAGRDAAIRAAEAASTAAVELMTYELARDLSRRDITVNAVATVLETAGLATAVADVVAFLVSDDGHRVSGQVIRVDERSGDPGAARTADLGDSAGILTPDGESGVVGPGHAGARSAAHTIPLQDPALSTMKSTTIPASDWARHDRTRSS